MTPRNGIAKRRFVPRGFTLVELLLAITILAVILTSLASIMGQTTRAWGNARSQLQQFREAETAFDQLTRRITDAVLNTYHDYEFPNGDKQKTPTRYVRQSEMHFVCGPASGGGAGIPALLGSNAEPGHAIFFQGPFGEHDDAGLTGLNTLLNAWGYFVAFGDDETERPSYLSGATGSSPRYRFRLKEFRQQTENLRVYETPLSTVAPGQLFDWFAGPVAAGQGVHTLAENVVALIIRPHVPEDSTTVPTAIAPNYYYDTRAYQRNAGGAFEQQRSRHQLPPLLEITLVVLDEASGARLQAQHGSAPPDFGLSGLFQNAAEYPDDIAELEATLIAQKVQFRILKKVVRLRNARWSTVD